MSSILMWCQFCLAFTVTRARASTLKPLVSQPSDAVADKWTVVYLIKEDINELLAFTEKPQLPARGQVLSLSYLHIREVKDKLLPVNKIVDIVLTEVCKFWSMGNILIMAKNKVKENRVSLINEYRYLRKSTCRQYDIDEQKRESFHSSLTKLCDIAARNAKEIMLVDRLLTPSLKI